MGADVDVVCDSGATAYKVAYGNGNSHLVAQLDYYSVYGPYAMRPSRQIVQGIWVLEQTGSRDKISGNVCREIFSYL